MTAQLIRLYADMPRELSRADLDAATDAHVDQLRRDRLPALRADWAANRLTQQQVLDAQNIKDTRRENRRLIGYGAAILLAFALALTIGHAIESAVTAHIAASLAE